MSRSISGILLLFFLFLNVKIFADGLDDAIALESSGNTERAIQAYLEWLGSNIDNPQFSDVLIHTASLYEQPIKTLSLLRDFLPELRHADSCQVFSRMAGLESSLGFLSDAAIHYKKASDSGSIEADRWFCDSLNLRFSMGEYSDVRAEALDLAIRTLDVSIRDEAAALSALCLAYSNDQPDSVSKALDEINRYINKNRPVKSPLLWFAMYKISLLQHGDSQAIEKAVNALENDFPLSVISYLIERKLPEWLSPSSYIFLSGELSADSVQVGAFRSREAAASLRMQLEENNFIAWIEQSGDVWRVFVNDPAGNAVSRLLDLGYDSLF